MVRNITIAQQFISHLLLISFFLQSCGSLSNSPSSNFLKEDTNKEVDYQPILDKEFSAEGGYVVTFYGYKDEILASLQSLDEKNKVYNSLEVFIEKEADVRGLPHLPESIQQQRIQIHCNKEGAPEGITIHKPWLMGGNSDSEDEDEEDARLRLPPVAADDEDPFRCCSRTCSWCNRTALDIPPSFFFK
ncbi:hypothetical protein GR268_43105, partial [Rhizobium leguminosarum]|nr:hypothetical protein [Rhizobium leguminosarum]